MEVVADLLSFCFRFVERHHRRSPRQLSFPIISRSRHSYNAHLWEDQRDEEGPRSIGESVLPFESKTRRSFPLRLILVSALSQIPFGHDIPYRIAYQPSLRAYGVAFVKTVLDRREQQEDMTSSFKLLDEDTFERESSSSPTLLHLLLPLTFSTLLNPTAQLSSPTTSCSLNEPPPSKPSPSTVVPSSPSEPELSIERRSRSRKGGCCCSVKLRV